MAGAVVSVSIVINRRMEGAMSSYQTQPSPLLPQQVLGVTILIWGVLFVSWERVMCVVLKCKELSTSRGCLKNLVGC